MKKVPLYIGFFKAQNRRCRFHKNKKDFCAIVTREENNSLIYRISRDLFKKYWIRKIERNEASTRCCTDRKLWLQDIAWLNDDPDKSRELDNHSG